MPKAGDLGDVHPQFFRASNAIQVESGSANLKKFSVFWPAIVTPTATWPSGVARRHTGNECRRLSALYSASLAVLIYPRDQPMFEGADARVQNNPALFLPFLFLTLNDQIANLAVISRASVLICRVFASSGERSILHLCGACHGASIP
jgi:hypothetical protein